MLPVLSKLCDSSHTDKRTHRTPPEHLAVSIVRRHENPPLRPLFEPTLQLHFLSSNLPNTLCSFCSLFKCLLQTEMHNIRHNTSSPPSIPLSLYPSIPPPPLPLLDKMQSVSLAQPFKEHRCIMEIVLSSSVLRQHPLSFTVTLVSPSALWPIIRSGW